MQVSLTIFVAGLFINFLSLDIIKQDESVVSHSIVKHPLVYFQHFLFFFKFNSV